MRRVVAGRNVFSWASDILEGLESLWTKPLHYSVRRWEETSVDVWQRRRRPMPSRRELPHEAGAPARRAVER